MDEASKFGNSKGKRKKKKKNQNNSTNKSANGVIVEAPISNILDESVEIDLETLYAKQLEMKEVKK